MSVKSNEEFLAIVTIATDKSVRKKDLMALLRGDSIRNNSFNLNEIVCFES
jgi:hypothetical protein